MTTVAEAGRWKAGGPIPAGVERRTATDGTVCWKSNETGTNQCRWKVDNGCKWVHESGSDQCTPGTPPAPAPVTFSATNGSLAITNEDDGDGDPETVQGTIRARYTATDDDVTFRVRVRVAGGYTVTRLSSSVRAVSYTDKTRLGSSIYRTAGGWQADQPPPMPPFVPPNGATCAVAWATFQATQLNCYTGSIGNNFVNGLQNGIWSAGGIAVGCALGGLSGLVQCAANPAKGVLIVEMIRGLFSSAYSGAACNSLAQATQAMNNQCFH